MKLEECLKAGEAIKYLLEQNITPKDIMTREAFENAMVLTMALGGWFQSENSRKPLTLSVRLPYPRIGSTNAVLHLVAVARTLGVNLTIDDFQAISDRVPFIADLKPR